MTIPTYLDLTQKGVEYYECALHFHPRGMRDVLEEARGIIKTLKAEGKTFDGMQQWIRENYDADFDYTKESDPFMDQLKVMWEEGEGG